MDKITLSDLLYRLNGKMRYLNPHLEFEVEIFGNVYKVNSKISFTGSTEILNTMTIHIDHLEIIYTLSDNNVYVEITNTNSQKVLLKQIMGTRSSITLGDVIGISRVKSARN